MTDYYISTSGSNTPPYNSWATAANDVLTAYAQGDSDGGTDDRYIVDSTHVDTNITNAVYTMPTRGRMISTNNPGDYYEYGAALDSTAGTYDLSLKGSPIDGGQSYYKGIKLLSGDDLIFSSTGNRFVLEDCLLKPGPSTSGDRITALTSAGMNIILNGCTIEYQDTDSYFLFSAGAFVDCKNLTVILAGNTTSIFRVGGSYGATLRIEDSDFSGLTLTSGIMRAAGSNGTDDVVKVYLKRVNLGSNLPFSRTSTRSNLYYDAWAGDDSDYGKTYGTRREGDIESSTAIYRTDGATYYTGAAFSYKFTPKAYVSTLSNVLNYTLKTPKLDLSLGATTLTIHLLLQDSDGEPASLTDMNCVLKASHPDSTNTVLGKIVSSSDKNILSTPADLPTEAVSFVNTSGTTKQHYLSVEIPQNTASGMDEAICELWLEVSTELAATTEMFVCPEPTVTAT